MLLSVIIAFAIFEGTLAAEDIGNEWLNTVGLCARVENAISATATHFVTIAADRNVEKSKEGLVNASNSFEDATSNLELRERNNALQVSIDVADKLANLTLMWDSFQTLITDNVNSIASKPIQDKQDLLNEVDTKKQLLLLVAGEITVKYVHKSDENGGPKAVTTLMNTVKQIMSISSMTNDLILTSLKMDRSANMALSVTDFTDRHAVLLEGDSLKGIPIMSDVCKLMTMREVTYLWVRFSAGLANVAASSTQTAERATTFLETGLADAESLLREMSKVRDLVIEDKDMCKPTQGIPKKQWWALSQRIGLQRVLSQKSVRLFTNIATEVMVSENKVELVMALDQAKSNLNDLLFGNKLEDIPSPLSKDVAGALKTSKGFWDQMSTDLRAAVSRDGYDERAMTACSRLSDPLLVSLNNVMEFFVIEAAANMPSLQAAVIDISGAQLVKICKLCKEAMLAALKIDTARNTEQIEDSITKWRQSHEALLRGGAPRTNTSSGVPKTTNVCLLQQMQEALDVHRALEKSARVLVKHGNNSAELHQLNLLAYAKMFDAVTMYGTIEDITCELKENSVGDFKSFLSFVGDLRMLIQRVQKQFLSKAVGLNATATEISNSFEQLIFGEKRIGIKAAPTQAIADALFDLEALWLELQSALGTSTAVVTPDSLSTNRNGVEVVMTSDRMEAVMEAYVKLSEEKVSIDELNARRIDLASRQRMLVEQMAKEAILASENSASDKQLMSTIAAYESAYTKMMDQTHSGRDELLKSMDAAQAAWVEYKTELLDVASGSRATELQTKLDLLLPILDEIVLLYAEVVIEPERPQRSSFLLLRVLIPLALVLGPSLLGFIRGFFSKHEDNSK
jgi:hypothetical protein